MFCKGIHTIWYLVVYIKQVDPEIVHLTIKYRFVLGYQIKIYLSISLTVPGKNYFKCMNRHYQLVCHVDSQSRIVVR